MYSVIAWRVGKGVNQHVRPFESSPGLRASLRAPSCGHVRVSDPPPRFPQPSPLTFHFTLSPLSSKAQIRFKRTPARAVSLLHGSFESVRASPIIWIGFQVFLATLLFILLLLLASPGTMCWMATRPCHLGDLIL